MKFAKKEKLVELEVTLEKTDITDMLNLLIRSQRTKFGIKPDQQYKLEWTYDSEVIHSDSADKLDTAIVNGIRIKITDIE